MLALVTCDMRDVSFRTSLFPNYSRAVYQQLVTLVALLYSLLTQSDSLLPILAFNQILQLLV